MNDSISMTSSIEVISEDYFLTKQNDKIIKDLNEENHQLRSAIKSNINSFQIEQEHLTKENSELKLKNEELVKNLKDCSEKIIEQEKKNDELKNENEDLSEIFKEESLNKLNLSKTVILLKNENNELKVQIQQKEKDNQNLNELYALSLANDNENKNLISGLQVQIKEKQEKLTSVSENFNKLTKEYDDLLKTNKSDLNLKEETLISNEKKYQNDLTKMSETFAAGVMEFEKIKTLKNKENDELRVQIDKLNKEIEKKINFINFHMSDKATQNKNKFEILEIKQMKSRSPHIPWCYGRYGNGPCYNPGATDKIERYDIQKFKLFRETTNSNSQLEIMEIILEGLNEKMMYKNLLDNVVQVLK